MSYNRMESATYLANLLAKGLSRSLASKAAGLGFSPGQFPVLVELWEQDGQTQKQLLDRLEIEQATLANTLARMERDGLIERRRHPTDRRAQTVHLTGHAMAMEDEAKKAADEADQQLFKGFKKFERELMLEYIRLAIKNAKKPG